MTVTTGSLKYGTLTPLAFSLASLPSSSGLLAGQQSEAFDNSSLGAFDVELALRFTTGASPAAGEVQLYAAPSLDGVNFSGGLTGADGVCSLTAEAEMLLILIATIQTNDTGNTEYTMSGISMLQTLGQVPPHMAFFLTQNTGADFDSGTGFFLDAVPVNPISQ